MLSILVSQCWLSSVSISHRVFVDGFNEGGGCPIKSVKWRKKIEEVYYNYNYHELAIEKRTKMKMKMKTKGGEKQYRETTVGGKLILKQKFLKYFNFGNMKCKQNFVLNIGCEQKYVSSFESKLIHCCKIIKNIVLKTRY